MKTLKIIVEKHEDGYVAYPVGVEGVVVGQGDSFEEALADVKSAIKFHVEVFGPGVLEIEEPTLDAFVAETTV
jgi:predicted RNase H-like HicB family nuclease